ncbi:MAG: hypothetical protein ACK5Z2_19530 [Bacteroidota bacterium]|jgi:hypothetical protein
MSGKTSLLSAFLMHSGKSASPLLPLEPVYTGKLMFAVDALVGRGELTGKILILHSGGVYH